jgi:hypothetical protein
MTDREMMQQALEALKLIDEAMPFPVAKLTIKNLRERLAQPEQESFSPEAISRTQAAWKMGYDAAKAEQPEQKPVPWESFFKRYCPWLEQPEQEPAAERAWFTIAELNAWADKKLSENPHWVMPKDKPERDEPPPEQDVPEASCGNMVPVGWLESPDGAFRANPLYKIQFPSSLLSWQLPLYTAPPQRKPPQFPTMLRKMWSGSEVQQLINENWSKT